MASDEFLTCYCPCCFERIYFGDCKIVSTANNNRSVIMDAPAPGSKEQKRAREHFEPLQGEKYEMAEARRECPNCQYLLPKNIEYVDCFPIAVVGNMFSGKSLYIAALLKQFAWWRKQQTDSSIRFICLTDDIAEKYEDNAKLLFRQKQIMDATLPPTSYIEPLIYELSIESSSRFKKEARKCNIMIYDVSGEVFTNRAYLLKYGKFALYAQAFIFLADPVTFDYLFDQLEPALQTQLEQNHKNGREPAELLGNFMAKFENLHVSSVTHSLSDIPIAIMVSKADLFQHLAQQVPNPIPQQYNPNFPQSNLTVQPFNPDIQHYTTSPGYGIKVDFDDVNRLDKEVRELLRKYQQGDLVSTARSLGGRNGENVRFFASTATGGPPDPSGNFTQAIDPHRCLDPFLWILYHLKMLGKK